MGDICLASAVAHEALPGEYGVATPGKKEINLWQKRFSSKKQCDYRRSG